MKLAYTFAEAAKMLDYADRQTIEQLVARGHIKAVRLTGPTGERRIPHTELERLISERLKEQR